MKLLTNRHDNRHFNNKHRKVELYLTNADYEGLSQKQKTKIQNQSEQVQSKSQRKRDQKLVKKTEKKLQKATTTGLR